MKKQEAGFPVDFDVSPFSEFKTMMMFTVVLLEVLKQHRTS